MSVAVTVLDQKHVPGLGTVTRGTFDLSSTYATGGDDSNLADELRSFGGSNEVDIVICGFSGDYTAQYNPANAKLRIFKIASGVMTERANASSYDADIAIPFIAFTR
jgi:hypothetical protein